MFNFTKQAFNSLVLLLSLGRLNLRLYKLLRIKTLRSPVQVAVQTVYTIH